MANAVSTMSMTLHSLIGVEMTTSVIAGILCTAISRGQPSRARVLGLSARPYGAVLFEWSA